MSSTSPVAAVMVFVADMVLGWETYNYDAPEFPPMFARFLLVSDERIIVAALLRLIGIPLEYMCWFSVYRLIKPYSEKYAHTYRAGIIGSVVIDKRTGEYHTIEETEAPSPLRIVKEIPEGAVSLQYDEDEFLHVNFEGETADLKQVMEMYRKYMSGR